MKHYFLPVLLLVLLSCGGGPKQKPFEKNFETVAGPENSSLRGVNLGDDYGTVMEKEPSEFMDYQDSSMIRYMIHYTDSEEYKIAYQFTGDFVTAIQMDVFLGEMNDGAKMISLFKTRFDKKYGFGEEQRGILTWSKNGESVELLDESEVYGYGKIQLLIFPTSNEPRPRTEAL